MLAIPVVLAYGMAVPVCTGVLRRDRVPWFLAKLVELYHRLVTFVLYPVVRWLCGGESGF